MLEADTITYQETVASCDAHGQPHLFDRDRCSSARASATTPAAGAESSSDALTNFTEGSTVWFLRGNVAQDSSSSRIYAGSSEITSCDLPDAALPLLGRGGEVDLEDRPGRPAGRALRPRRPDPVAAVHFSGRPTRSPLGDPDSAVRAQRSGPARPGRTTGRSPTSDTTGRRTITSILRHGSTGSPTAMSSTAWPASIAGSTGS